VTVRGDVADELGGSIQPDNLVESPASTEPAHVEAPLTFQLTLNGVSAVGALGVAVNTKLSGLGGCVPGAAVPEEDFTPESLVQATPSVKLPALSTVT
jgi:hypothetical protein